MLQEQSRLFQRVMFFADVALIVASWLAAYWIRFEVLIPPEWVPLSRYFGLLPWVLIVSALVFWASGLYAPDRAQRLLSLVYAVAKAVVLGLLVLAASLSFYRAFSFSRLMMIIFGMITPALMILSRLCLYAAIRHRFKQGKRVKRVLIYGAGNVGRKLGEAFERYPWLGMEVVGFVDDYAVDETDVLGTGQNLIELIDRQERDGQPIHDVYLALPLSAADRIAETVERLSKRLVHVFLVPDLIQFNMLNSRVTHIDSMPVIHVIDEPPLELSLFVKRLVDVAFSFVVLVVTAPVMALIAVLVKLQSPGPVLYRQQRMGLNGKTFDIIKFRTMPVDAEDATGPVWARADERRATRIGAFLRRTSLDELPQFINVLKGDMSVVGPRPERPVFIEQFREHIPGYMLRHKTKAGITGWAQVNGWRGNTSIEKRIEYDIYYIQNWSLKLDLKIMWMTLWRGFVDQNAY